MRSILVGLIFVAACATTQPSAPPTVSDRVTHLEWVDTAAGRTLHIVAGMKPPPVTHRTNPMYKESDRAAGVQGPVEMDVLINETGRVIQCSVLSAPSSSLGESACEAVREWTYAATQVEYRPVPVLTRVTINFSL